jgi:HK97 family phage major capsid protein/HK97 family phage prohead protease
MTTHKHIKPGSIAHRSFAVDRAALDEESRTIELTFSSEAPYERSWGVEVLDHTPQSIRLGRLQSGGPLLMDHDVRDQVGVIESVRIGEDRKGRAVVRFGRGARADEIYNDVKDVIRRNVSVGYVIHDAVVQESRADKDVYRVSDWEPFEISIVSVPADASVGIGRSAETNDQIEFIEPEAPAETIKESAMTEEIKAAPMIDVQQVESGARSAEQKRIADILSIGDQFAKYGADKMTRDAISGGASVDQFRQHVLERVSTQPLPTADIGLTQREAKNFSFIRAINALAATGAESRKAREMAAFEIECSNAVSEKMGKEARGIFVPTEVQNRDLVVGTATAGGHTVATDLLASSFIDLLRNRMSVMSAGARMMTGLVGNIAIPRQTGAATAYWVTESNAPTESQQAFDQVLMSPKTVGAFTDISRKLLLQSSIDVEALVRSDLATVLGLEIDRAALNGSGSAPEPRGVMNTVGIGSVIGGGTGLAPNWGHIVALETAIATANADIGNMAYVTNAKVRGKLKATFVDGPGTGIPVFQQGDTPLNGYRAIISNQVPSNLVKTTTGLSAILFGNWADLLVGMWGSLDLMVDPYTHSTSGTVRVVALQDVDVAVRHVESFAAMLDAITT